MGGSKNSRALELLHREEERQYAGVILGAGVAHAQQGSTAVAHSARERNKGRKKRQNGKTKRARTHTHTYTVHIS